MLYSFSNRKKIVDVAPKIRKLIDLTSPNLPQVNDARANRRYNRSVPVFLCDWSKPGEAIEVENRGVGFTTDISDIGFSILTTFRPMVHDNIIGMYIKVDEIEVPWFFHVEFVRYQRLPQKFKRIGYRVIEFLNDEQHDFAIYLERMMRETLEKDIECEEG